MTKFFKDNKIYNAIEFERKRGCLILRIFLLIIGIISLVCGVKFIYDARPIVKKYFSFGDKNEASMGLKILGFLLTIIGGTIMYFVY